MRAYLVLLILLVTGCKTANPDFCCTTEQQCTELGASELRPCKAGQACDTGTCVAKECDTSADCTDASQPVCINQLCEAKCTGDADCAGSPRGPHCASDGVCVGCADASQCSTDKPFCDDQTRSCRGCIADSECSSGVCLEADARCAVESELLFVSAGTGQDAGTCSRATPCKTLGFALAKVDATHKVLRLDASPILLAAAFDLNRDVYIDGSDTTIALTAAGPTVRVPAFVNATLGHVSVTSSSGAALDIATNATLRLSLSLASGAVVSGTLKTANSTFTRQVTTTGTVDASGSTFSSDILDCTGGTLTASTSTFNGISAMNCQVTLARDRLQPASPFSLFTMGGVTKVENCLVVQSDPNADNVDIRAAGTGSTIRFTTFVNTTPVVCDAVALRCDGTIDVTSNVFAFNSMHPMGGPASFVCPSKFTLFDDAAVMVQTMGEGNKVAPASKFFVDKSGGDYHLGPASPAKGMADPTLTAVTVDFDGHARPLPAGTTRDVGAFEAP